MSTTGLLRLLAALLWLCYWLVFGYACALGLRAGLEWLTSEYPELRPRFLLFENTLVALTDPLLSPIRSALRPLLPDWMDLSPLVGALLCVGVDFLIVSVAGRLPSP